MAPIATYVFFDLETTGVPSEENNKTKITELSMVAVNRDHVLDTKPGSSPRVQHKLTRCFNPAKRISDGSSSVTGLDNFLLEHERKFDVASFEMINSFLNTLTKPVCLVSHNGLNFDFPILKRQLEMLNVSLSDDIMCADTFFAFYDILQAKKTIETSERAAKVGSVDEADLSAENTLSMKAVNETTPRKVKLKRPHADNVRKRFPWSFNNKPKESYALANVYERVLQQPAVGAHRAETDCLLALEIAVAVSKEFVSWVDDNNRPFADIPAMTVGVRINN